MPSIFFRVGGWVVYRASRQILRALRRSARHRFWARCFPWVGTNNESVFWRCWQNEPLDDVLAVERCKFCQHRRKRLYLFLGGQGWQRALCANAAIDNASIANATIANVFSANVSVRSVPAAVLGGDK